MVPQHLMKVDASRESLMQTWSTSMLVTPSGVYYLLVGIIVMILQLVLDVLQVKALSTSKNHILSMHPPNHVNQIRNISSKDNYYRNDTTRKFNYVYFNKGSSESAFFAAGSVIEVIQCVLLLHLTYALLCVIPQFWFH